MTFFLCGLRQEFLFCLGPALSWGHLVGGLSRDPCPGSQEMEAPSVPLERHQLPASPRLLNDSIPCELLETGSGMASSLHLCSFTAELFHRSGGSASGEEPWAWHSATADSSLGLGCEPWDQSHLAPGFPTFVGKEELCLKCIHNNFPSNF